VRLGRDRLPDGGLQLGEGAFGAQVAHDAREHRGALANIHRRRHRKGLVESHQRAVVIEAQHPPPVS
jgi:hypothetical protein